MTPPIESHMQKKHGKNTVGRNEFTDFEKFEVEHPNFIKTIAAHRPQVIPRRGITLQARRSTSHMHSEAQRRKAMKFAPARTREQFRGWNRSPASSFEQIFENRNFRPNLWDSFSASLQIHLLYFLDAWVHLNIFDL